MRRLVLLLMLSLLAFGPARAQEDVGMWTTRAPLPTARQEMPHVVLGGKIYVPGGIDAGRQGSARVEVYDPATDTWATAPPMPIALHHLGAAAVGGRLYVLGGYLGNAFSPTRRVFAYDPATEAWTEKTMMPGARGAHAAVAIDGKIYVVGGIGRGVVEEALHVYDPATDTWATGAPMPGPREHLAAAALGGQLYVVGGRVTDDFMLLNLAALHRYDPATDAWEHLAPMPTPRGGLAAAAVGERLYVFGGEEFSGVGPGVFSENEEYDPATDTWRAVAPMTVARHGLGAATLGGAIYLIGGGARAGFDTNPINEVFLPPRVTSATAESHPVRAADYAGYPNPFFGETTFRFEVLRTSVVRLVVYDVRGRAVATLADGPLPPGRHHIRWNVGRLPAGLYLARLYIGSGAATLPVVKVGG